MSTPRRRPSKAVYRRRRLVVLVVLVLVIGAIVWLVVAQPWRGWGAASSATPSVPSMSPAATPHASASPTASATTEPSPSASPAASPATPAATAAPVATAKPCVSGDILVEALTDSDSYASGRNPQLSIRLTNRGSGDCTMNVGTSTQKFTVTSGDDVWWRSTDCQTEPSDMIVTLAAGQTVTSATPVVWDRTRSSVETCGDAGRPTAPGGGASYHVTVEIGGIPSAQSQQILLY